MEIKFRDIDPYCDFKFFAQVRRDSSFYLDDANDFEAHEVKKFLEINSINYNIVSVAGVPVGYLRQKIVKCESIRLQSVGLDLALQHRGKKLAIPIYQKLIKEKNKGGLPIVLWVLDFNTRAIHIYEKLGFKFLKSSPFAQKGSFRHCNRIMMEHRG